MPLRSARPALSTGGSSEIATISIIGECSRTRSTRDAAASPRPCVSVGRTAPAPSRPPGGPGSGPPAGAGPPPLALLLHFATPGARDRRSRAGAAGPVTALDLVGPQCFRESERDVGSIVSPAP